MKKLFLAFIFLGFMFSIKCQTVDWSSSVNMGLMLGGDTIINAPTITQNPNKITDVLGATWTCECDVENLNKAIRISIGGGSKVLDTLESPVYPGVYYYVYSFNTLPSDSFPYRLSRSVLARYDNIGSGADSIFTKTFVGDYFYFTTPAIKVYKDSVNTTGVFNFTCKFRR